MIPPSQEKHRDGPSIKGHLRKYLTWVLPTLAAREAQRKLLQTQIQQATEKAAMQNSGRVGPGSFRGLGAPNGSHPRADGYLFQLG